ncbi:uncharacterized protein [Euwallacea similis]|uniref:uncharacterized protein n=1 Tax=Euwallacea similis TaxID=1736056 RepID=UPI003450FCD4
MDFEDILKDWRNHQGIRAKMVNRYPCRLTFSFNGNVMEGNLSFVGTHAERRIEVHLQGGSFWQMLLSEILGSSPEGSRIRFSLAENQFMFLEFPNQRIQEIAHEQWVTFEREEHGLTPPSSSDSD